MSNQNHITDLHIENFKSIKSMDLKPKRINIFVGKPNVGKSNILEALSVLSRKTLMKDVVRFKNAYELFFDNDINNTIHINSNIISSFIAKQKNSSKYDWVLCSDRTFLEITYSNYIENGLRFIRQHIETNHADFQNDNEKDNSNLSIIELEELGRENYIGSFRIVPTSIKRYKFKDDLTIFNNISSHFLEAPYGENLLTILMTNKSLRQDVASFFDEYKLEFLIDQKQNIFEIIKKTDGILTRYDYALAADTLRRVIFHLAAIKSNQDSILLFEEPEAHCFPPYISRIAQEMVDSKTNQIFVATHSPYLLNTIVANTDYEECAVFVTSYKDYQTHVRELTKEEIGDMLNFGTDVFINYDAFVEE